MAKDPNKVAQKWKTNLSSAGPSITDGINAVTEAPGIAAARNVEGYIQGILNAREKWVKRVGSVPLETWRQKALTVGVPRISQGATANVDKVEGFMREFLPHVEAGQQMLKTMPKVSLDDGINRMVAMVRHNAKFQRTR